MGLMEIVLEVFSSLNDSMIPLYKARTVGSAHFLVKKAQQREIG